MLQECPGGGVQKKFTKYHIPVRSWVRRRLRAENRQSRTAVASSLGAVGRARPVSLPLSLQVVFQPRAHRALVCLFIS